MIDLLFLNVGQSYVYYTQIMQAETLAAAYRLWRRNWKGRGREYTAGALVWQVCLLSPFIILARAHRLNIANPQINDCWPVTSWAIVDYFLRPKPAYFTIARELLPYTVGMSRKDVKTFADEHTAAFFTIRSVLEIWATNSTLSEKRVTLQVTSFDLDKTEWRDHWEKEVVLKPNVCTEVWKGDVPGQPVRTKESEVPKAIIVSARLVDLQSGVVLSRYSNWYVHL